jgi:hypothetical protein
MMEEKIEFLYKVGDRVRVKDFETLKQELGNPHNAWCGWDPKMDQYCGQEYLIEATHAAVLARVLRPYYHLVGCPGWIYTEDVLEPVDIPPISIDMKLDDLVDER